MNDSIRQQKNKMIQKQNFFIKNKDEIELLTKLLTFFSIIGFAISSYVIYKYFNIYNIQAQIIDTNTFISISLCFLLLIFIFNIITIFPTIMIFYSLKDYKDKRDIKSTAKTMLIRVAIFWTPFTLMSSYMSSKLNLLFLIMFILVIILYIYGYKKIYTQDKFIEKSDANIWFSLDFIFPYFTIVFFSLLVSNEKPNIGILGLLIVFLLTIFIFSIPFLFTLMKQNISNKTFIILQFLIGFSVIFIYSQRLLPERTIQILNIGSKKYDELILSKQECERLAQSPRLGYKCDKNNTLKNMYGVWIIGDKPIFGKLAIKKDILQKDMLDAKSKLIWLQKNEIQSQL